MTSAVAIFRDVGKRFRLGGADHPLVSAIRRWFLNRSIRPTNRTPETFWALRNIDFELKPGEALGIVGPNGSGKSTVLKLMAGILRADEGQIETRGRVTALIEVGAGFHGELTGRENIYLNGAILGMSRGEIRAKLESIVAFSGVARFLDMPVKHYSSGMYARLGFSIAAHVEPRLLLVDEVLSVGDAAFRLRCLDRMKALLRNGTGLVLVTHQLDQLVATCSRAIVLCGGRSTFAGDSRDAVDHYLQAMSESLVSRPTDLTEQTGDREAGAVVRSLRLIDDAGDETIRMQPRQSVTIEMEYELRGDFPRVLVELNLRGSNHDQPISFNSGRSGSEWRGRKGINNVSLRIAELPLAGGQYFWNVRIWNGETGETLVDSPYRFPLMIDDGGRATGTLCIDHEWSPIVSAESDSFDPIRTGISLLPSAFLQTIATAR